MNRHERNKHALIVHKNIYGQVQAGKVWYDYLANKLTSIGFKKCQRDECIFTLNNIIYIVYTDDSILAGPDNNDIQKCIQDMRYAHLNLTIKGDIANFLGIKFTRHKQQITMTQEHLINAILRELKLDKENTNTKCIPMASTKILSRHPDSPKFDQHFHCRRVIGMLNYLERCTRPDIVYARFCENPKIEHSNAIKWLGRYLRGIRTKGIQATFKDEPFTVYIDADFAGNWDDTIATYNRDTACSRHGYIIIYMGIPITWASQLQTEIALSTTESEYIGLSTVMRRVIPIMELLEELRTRNFNIGCTKPIITCTAFEDNEGAAEMARVPKMRPRTKHINIKYHHFRSFIDEEKIDIDSIDGEAQPADMMMKPLNEGKIIRHRRKIMGC